MDFGNIVFARKPVRGQLNDTPGRQFLWAFQGTLPDVQYSPAVTLQFTQYLAVPFPVACDLLPPPVASRGRPFEQVASVTVPETTMHEDYGAARRKNKVRTPWQAPGVQAESITGAMQALSNKHFRSSVFSTNAGHHPAAGFPVDNVSHATFHWASVKQFPGLPANSSSKAWIGAAILQMRS
jgi:hypothetical protein